MYYNAFFFLRSLSLPFNIEITKQNKERRVNRSSDKRHSNGQLLCWYVHKCLKVLRTHNNSAYSTQVHNLSIRMHAIQINLIVEKFASANITQKPAAYSNGISCDNDTPHTYVNVHIYFIRVNTSPEKLY